MHGFVILTAAGSFPPSSSSLQTMALSRFDPDDPRTWADVEDVESARASLRASRHDEVSRSSGTLDPDDPQSWADYVDHMPVLHRDDVQADGAFDDELAWALRASLESSVSSPPHHQTLSPGSTSSTRAPLPSAILAVWHNVDEPLAAQLYDIVRGSFAAPVPTAVDDELFLYNATVVLFFADQLPTGWTAEDLRPLTNIFGESGARVHNAIAFAGAGCAHSLFASSAGEQSLDEHQHVRTLLAREWARLNEEF